MIYSLYDVDQKYTKTEFYFSRTTDKTEGNVSQNCPRNYLNGCSSVVKLLPAQSRDPGSKSRQLFDFHLLPFCLILLLNMCIQASNVGCEYSSPDLPHIAQTQRIWLVSHKIHLLFTITTIYKVLPVKHHLSWDLLASNLLLSWHMVV